MNTTKKFAHAAGLAVFLTAVCVGPAQAGGPEPRPNLTPGHTDPKPGPKPGHADLKPGHSGLKPGQSDLKPSHTDPKPSRWYYAGGYSTLGNFHVKPSHAQTKECINEGGASASATTLGSPGPSSGNIVQNPITGRINVCGNTINVGGIGDPASGGGNNGGGSGGNS
ncbi:chaplin [Streptomyces sp. NPDC088116]|uniref:chaplin n=1 Tax=Streptomyces sp. NPDC088116 TaxID=3365825 RepID=UPI0037F7A6BE